MNEPHQADPVRPSILIVDDNSNNLKVLKQFLGAEYRVRPATSGELALRSARHEAPDLILLDIMMSGMDGFAVCEALKADPALRDIPVIFVSALDDSVDKVKGFASGAVDYISKPFQIGEVKARVRTHVRLRTLQLEAEERSKKLTEAYEKLREVESLRDSLVHMMAHDLRGPLTLMRGYLQLLQRSKDPERDARYLARTILSCENLNEMISGMLDINRMESNRLEVKLMPVDIVAQLRRWLDRVVCLEEYATIELVTHVLTCMANVDVNLFDRVVANLVYNALKFTPSDKKIIIEVQVDPCITVHVHDQGEGIPAEALERIFDKFSQVANAKARTKYSSGLGLTFCKMVVELHGGKIGASSILGEGSDFWFTLTSAEAPEVASGLLPKW